MRRWHQPINWNGHFPGRITIPTVMVIAGATILLFSLPMWLCLPAIGVALILLGWYFGTDH